MLRFYRDLLGADANYEFRDDNVQVAYVGLRIGEADLGITADPDAAMRPGERFSLWTYTDDCDAAIARLRDAGVTIVDEPSDQPWGERMATVTDPDGNVVRVAQAPRD